MPEKFLPNGNLTPGIHIYNIQDFEQQFVTDFNSSVRRQAIYCNFKQWLKQLLYVLPPRYIWIDGSYLTKKLEPKDIDLVTIYYPEDIQNKQQAEAVKRLINIVSRSLDCDAYLSFSFEHWTGQQLASIQDTATIMQTYWMGQFGFDRVRQPKGIIQINQQELISINLGGETP